jgi:amino acid adenylation domain-containing protein
VQSAALFDVTSGSALRAAAAVECLHCYSLVHDDLPAMDDDDLRRGRPTVHRAFDEATAILAGDSLQALAFEILAEAKTHDDPAVRSTLVLELAKAAGETGMVGGQMLDLMAKEKPFINFAETSAMQGKKTGALIRFACESGAILGGADRSALASYGEAIGLAFQIADSRASVILSQQRLLAGLPEQPVRVVCLDRVGPEADRQSAANPHSALRAEHLAYIIYTSGSTGRPKGVEVPHRGITRLLFGVDYAQLDSTQTFCHMAPISFDAATFELWGALLYGAKCVLYPGTFPTPAELKEVLHQNKVSVLWLTASLFNTVIDEAPEALSEVRQLLIGGEPVSVKHVRRALDLLPETQIVNCYGPTESTTFACCYPIPRQLDESLRSVPIGRPISNTRVYILDARLEPVPVGIPGELYIGGDGLARGYLNRPELTAERFIAIPLGHESEERLYKTGDRVRYEASGNIEFLERIDKQVKIRGFRIEPAEIEAFLGQYPGLRDAVVLAREQMSGDKRLVAYVLRDPDHDFTSRELRKFLKRHLPEYMVPSTFIFLDSLPLTPNGKVDYHALPDPRYEDMQECEYVAPRDETERVLCRVWSELLGVSTVGLDDNFFALGGHSLLAAKLFTRLDEEFGRSLSLGVLFRAPTVRLLAECYRTSVGSQGSSVIVPLSTGGKLPPVFAVPGVFGNVLAFEALAREPGDEEQCFHRFLRAP